MTGTEDDARATVRALFAQGVRVRVSAQKMAYLRTTRVDVQEL